jgi:hypothetical protein
MPNKLILHGFILLFIVTMSFSGCAPLIERLPTGLILNGGLRAAFERVVAHKIENTTIEERKTIFGTANPTQSAIDCDERVHRDQALRISQMHLAAEWIEDTSAERRAAFLEVYGHQYLFHGYNNRFEHEALKACQKADAPPESSSGPGGLPPEPQPVS